MESTPAPVLDLRTLGVFGTMSRMFGAADRVLASTARDNAAAALRQQVDLRRELESQACDWLADPGTHG